MVDKTQTAMSHIFLNTKVVSHWLCSVHFVLPLGNWCKREFTYSTIKRGVLHFYGLNGLNHIGPSSFSSPNSAVPHAIKSMNMVEIFYHSSCEMFVFYNCFKFIIKVSFVTYTIRKSDFLFQFVYLEKKHTFQFCVFQMP